MKTYFDLTLALSLLMATSSGVYVADGDEIHGQELYQSRCFSCHSIDANRVGPMHRDLVDHRLAVSPIMITVRRLRTLNWSGQKKIWIAG